MMGKCKNVRKEKAEVSEETSKIMTICVLV
jgi:hypothetical protein